MGIQITATFVGRAEAVIEVSAGPPNAPGPVVSVALADGESLLATEDATVVEGAIRLTAAMTPAPAPAPPPAA